MKQFVLDHLSNACSVSQHIVGCTQTAEADLSIRLDTGKTVAVYVINRAIRIPEIRETFEQNTARRVHTLYIVDGRMMPGENAEVDPPHWMEALHSLTQGRVYAYWCDGRKITIRAVHLEWKWGGSPRAVEYGPSVDVGKLRTGMVDCASKHITGYYAMADFSDMYFWKKRDPNDAKQPKYSWRQWNFSRERKAETPNEQQNWDAWNEFARQYGQTEGAGQNYENYRKRQRKERKQSAKTYVPLHRYYQALGVPITATYEEIKRAYRVKAREYHPDLHPPHEKDKYTSMMADINAAFEAISKRIK
jgi:hypothetical protein